MTEVTMCECLRNVIAKIYLGCKSSTRHFELKVREMNKEIYMIITMGIIGRGRAQCVRTTLPLKLCLRLNTTYC